LNWPDVYIFFFVCFFFFVCPFIIGLSVASPVFVIPGVVTPVPVELGCGADGFAPVCANAPPTEKPIKVAARIIFRISISNKRPAHSASGKTKLDVKC
jgi:hypothetical protein